MPEARKPACATVPLKELLRPAERYETPAPGQKYRQLGVQLWGKGAYEREQIDGAATKYSTFNRLTDGDVVVNKIWARHGSVAVVPEALSGCCVSPEFPAYTPNTERLTARWMHWLTRSRTFWAECDEASRGSSGKNRIRPEKFLAIKIPLPDIPVQEKITGNLDAVEAKLQAIKQLRAETRAACDALLFSLVEQLKKKAEWMPLSAVAPLVRRPVNVNIEHAYPELGIRSFGRGTFHKPDLAGAAVGTKKLYTIKTGDLLFSNVFAWEGAIAVARPEDDGRVGSHRYITCVAEPGIASPFFLCTYFLGHEGLEKVRLASPGGAGRNRTLGLEALAKIVVPVPSYPEQMKFEALYSHLTEIQARISDGEVELEALLPALLDRALKGSAW